MMSLLARLASALNLPWYTSEGGRLPGHMASVVSRDDVAADQRVPGLMSHDVPVEFESLDQALSWDAILGWLWVD